MAVHEASSRPRLRRILRWTGRFAIGILVLVVGAGCIVFWLATEQIAGYKAKIFCSAILVSGRPQPVVLQEDVNGWNYISLSVDSAGDSVTARALGGLIQRQALHRPGLGCTLLNGTTREELLQQVSVSLTPLPVVTPDWPAAVPVASFLPPEIDAVALQKAVEAAFQEPDPERLLRTRAVAILYQGNLVAERYATGFDQATPLLGWSMTKSVINALVGILAKEGKLELDHSLRVPEWSGDAQRSRITLRQLLQMSSGLQFQEVYFPPLDATRMLFDSFSAAGVAADKGLDYPPGTHWSYSSGTTNIISRGLAEGTGSSSEYFELPRRRLFDVLGMSTAVIEPDPSGHWVGSSFMYASARDWARFGQLYLQDGVWDGERILPEGWVQFSSTALPHSSRGRYGAHFWTNGTPEMEAGERPLRGLPSGTFYASGFEGQFVYVIPSWDLVVVRLGLTQSGGWSMPRFVRNVLASIRRSP